MANYRLSPGAGSMAKWKLVLKAEAFRGLAVEDLEGVAVEDGGDGAGEVSAQT